ncbi:MAG: hypothetical protein KF817_12055 [Phycisphaeraceae bacterium]|nr:hypothetical protein [Phycisphaeraceae bacterium]
MADLLLPGKTVTFTVSCPPRTPAAQKTLQRLMRMQPKIQRGLSRLRKLRDTRNDPRQRAGRVWIVRVQTTKLTRVEPGESFTLRLTPQILPDIRSVADHLEMKAG